MNTKTLDLPVKLDDDELRELGDEVAAQLLKRDELAEEKREAASRYRNAIKGVESHAAELAEQIRTRRQIRPVECVVMADSTRQMMITVRGDTEEVVDARDMSPSEMRTLDAARPDRLGNQRHVVRRRAPGQDFHIVDRRHCRVKHDVAVVVEEQGRVFVRP